MHLPLVVRKDRVAHDATAHHLKAVERFAKPRGFSLLLCAKPTVWLRCIPITATTLDVVDAAVARDLCAKRNLPLDRAAGWHGGVIREKKIASVAWAE